MLRRSQPVAWTVGPGNNQLPALKEWGITLQALLQGKQQCLIRRGGIKEKAFHCPETPFLLFPTGFHSDESLLKPDTAAVYHKDLIWDPKDATQIPVEKQFTTMDRNAFKRLDGLHIWTEDFLDQRLGNKKRPITALLLRVWEFEEPVNVPQCVDYWGCFSWVNLPGNLFEYACETATEVHPERPWADIEAEFQAASLDSSI